jgi:hypothetical protein
MDGPPTPPLEAGGPGPLLEHLERQREEWLAYLDSEPDFEAMAQRREGGQVPRREGAQPADVELGDAVKALDGAPFICWFIGIKANEAIAFQ